MRIISVAALAYLSALVAGGMAMAQDGAISIIIDSCSTVPIAGAAVAHIHGGHPHTLVV